MTDFHYTTDKYITEDIQRACDVMRRGGIVIYPTDTVWGIGCDATSSKAVKRIYEIKRRADSKAMIVLVDSLQMLERHVETVPDVAYQLIECSEGSRPLTIVYDKGINLASELLGDNGSIGIRFTRELYSAGLCRCLRKPVVSTSANISGSPSAALYSEISSEILDAVDYVADYRRDDIRKSQPSMVMRLSADGTFKILRP